MTQYSYRFALMMLVILGMIGCRDESATEPGTPDSVIHRAPVLLSPADGDSIYTPYTFEWRSTDSCTVFQIQIASTPDFASPTLDRQVDQDQRYSTSDIFPEGQMLWRVGCISGDTIVYSPARSVFFERSRILQSFQRCELVIEGIELELRKRMVFILNGEVDTTVRPYAGSRLPAHQTLMRVYPPISTFHGVFRQNSGYKHLLQTIDIRVDPATSAITSMSITEFHEDDFGSFGFNTHLKDTLNISGDGIWFPSEDDQIYELRGQAEIESFFNDFRQTGKISDSDILLESRGYVYWTSGFRIHPDAKIRLEFHE